MSLATAREAESSFRGWRILGWSTIALVLTAPGQTIGVSSFTDHMIADLGVDRSTLSLAYLVGTLIAATAMPAVGRWVDRRGVSHTMTCVGIAFVASIGFIGFAQNIVMAGAAFVGLRMLGQGSLSLIGQTSISLWFEKRRGRAFAIATTVSTGADVAYPPRVHCAYRSGWVAFGMVVHGWIHCSYGCADRSLRNDRPASRYWPGARRTRWSSARGFRSAVVLDGVASVANIGLLEHDGDCCFGVGAVHWPHLSQRFGDARGWPQRDSSSRCLLAYYGRCGRV